MSDAMFFPAMLLLLLSVVGTTLLIGVRRDIKKAREATQPSEEG